MTIVHFVQCFHSNPSPRSVRRLMKKVLIEPGARPVASAAQVGVFREPDFSFAEGPVLEAHQAENGHQLRLREVCLENLPE